MDFKHDIQRRGFLSGVGVAIVGVAGCTTQGDQPTDTQRPSGRNGTTSPGGAGSPTDGPTNTTGTTNSPDETPREPPAGSGEPDPWTGLEKGEPLDSFDSFEADWEVRGGSATLSEAIAYDETAVFMATDGGPRATIRRQFGSPRDFTGTAFSMAIRLDGTTSGAIHPQLIVQDLFGKRRFLTGSIQGTATDRWVRLDLGVRDDEGVDMSVIKEMRVHLWDADDVTRFYVDDIRTHPTPETGYVMFTFDDAHPQDYSVAFPTLHRFGLQGAFFPTVNHIGRSGNPSVDDYLEIQDHGWDIGAHTLDHEQLPHYSRREQELILSRNKEWLEDNGFAQGSRLFRTPYSAYDSNTLDLLPEFFDLSIIGAGSAKGINFEVSDPRTVGFRGGDDYEQAKSFIDVAVEYQQLLGLTIHMNSMESEEAFEDLVAHAARHVQNDRLEVITPSTFLDDHVLA